MAEGDRKFSPAQTTSVEERELDPTYPDSGLEEARFRSHLMRHVKRSQPPPQVGVAGNLIEDVVTEIAGGEVTLARGTVVKVIEVRGDKLLCKIYSGQGGREAIISREWFQPQPALGVVDEGPKKGEPDEHFYQQYLSVLWDGAPKAADVGQGGLLDCYFVAAMGAVAAANSDAIKRLFSPHTPNQSRYRVTLYKKVGNTLQPHTEVVDTFLPSDRKRGRPAYAQDLRALEEHEDPLWPALLEKACAQMLGGYDMLDKGGATADAMEVITGVPSECVQRAEGDDELIEQFRRAKMEGRAISVTTLDNLEMADQAGFTLDCLEMKEEGATADFEGPFHSRGLLPAGDGPFRIRLQTPDGEFPRVKPGSLTIVDVKGKAPRVADDGHGQLIGDRLKSGAIDYRAGKISDLSYESEQGPARPHHLRAQYSYRGLIDGNLHLYTYHSYIFERVDEERQLILKNPWGQKHPKPVPVADFRRLFDNVLVTNLPPPASKER